MPAIHEFVNSAEVRRLARAFLRIPRPAVRHRIAAFVRELATIRRDLMLNSPEAEEFFDLARYGLMLAEQMADDATRESLLKLVRAWVAAERQATQLAGRDECLSLLAGFCSGLAAALNRGLFAVLFAAASALTACASFRRP